MNQQNKSLVMKPDKVPGSFLNDCVCWHHLRTLHSRVWKCTLLELCWLTNLVSIIYLVCSLGHISSSHYTSFFLSVKHDKSFYIQSLMGLTNIKQRNHIIPSLDHGSHWINAGISRCSQVCNLGQWSSNGTYVLLGLDEDFQRDAWG